MTKTIRGWRQLLFMLPPFLATLSAPAQADSPSDVRPDRVSAFAGVFIPQATSWSGAGTLSGIPFSATGKLSSKTGSATGILAGHTFLDLPDLRWLNIDLAAGYVTSTFDHFSGTINLAGLGSVTGPVPLSGGFHTYVGFVNFLATPFGIRQLLDDRVTPYIGLGVGVANSSAKLRSFQLNGTTLPVNASSNETDFAFNSIVGADYSLSSHWDVGLFYQYSWIDTKHLGGGAGITANSGSSSGHTFGLILEYGFDDAP